MYTQLSWIRLYGALPLILSIFAITVFSAYSCACVSEADIARELEEAEKIEAERDKKRCAADPGARGCADAICRYGPDKCTDCGRAEHCMAARPDGDKRQFACNQLAGECVHICTKSSDCSTGQICEDLRCRQPLCASDSDCPKQQCINGSCAAKVEKGEVASCAVEPALALLNVGKEAEFSILTRDDTGQVLPYLGSVIWSSNKAQISGSKTNAFVTASEEGTVVIHAKVGNVECRAATANAYPSLGSGTRVVVAESSSLKPIVGATVMIGSLKQPTTETGSAHFQDLTGNKTVSVFHPDYSFVTLVNTQSNDLIVFLKKALGDVGFKGSKSI